MKRQPLLILLLALALAPAVGASAEVELPEINVEGHVREDGRIDYLAAANDTLSEGVTPENNAFVVIARLMPDDAWESERLRLKRFDMLGIDPPGPESPRFLAIDAYAEQQAEDDPRWSAEVEQEAFGEVRMVPAWQAQWDRAMAGPWTPDDVPLVAEWLEAHDAMLDQISEGTQRPRYWSPYVRAEEDGLIVDARLPWMPAMRTMASGLCVRAHRRLADGNVSGVIDDHLAVKRMGQLLREPLFTIEVMVGVGIDVLTVDVTASLVAHKATTEDQAQRLQAALAELPARFPMEAVLFWSERRVMLDLLQRPQLATDVLEVSPEHPLVQVNGDRLDRKRAERRMNALFHRIGQLVVKPTRGEREEGLREAQLILREMERRVDAAVRKVDALDRAALTDAVVDFQGHASLEVKWLRLPSRVADQAAASGQLERTALALARYRLAHEAYPDSLDDLVPRYLDAVPIDICDAEQRPIRYRLTEDRVLLYSVGRDGEDDGGDDGAAGDLVLTWPR